MSKYSNPESPTISRSSKLTLSPKPVLRPDNISVSSSIKSPAKSSILRKPTNLSVDTGIRKMLRKQLSIKSTTKDKPQLAVLPAIQEKEAKDDVPDHISHYSPTRYLKESLYYHGKMENGRDSFIGGRGDLYEDFVETNYQLENEMS